MNTPINDNRPVSQLTAGELAAVMHSEPADAAARRHDTHRLLAAIEFYSATLSPTSLDAPPGKLIDRAIEHADKLVERHAAFTRPASTPPVPPPAPSLSLAAVRLLAALCRQGRLEPWEQRDCPPATRELLKAGVAAYSTPLGDLVPTPDGIALMRGDSWNETTTSPPPTSAGPTTATPSSACSGAA